MNHRQRDYVATILEKLSFEELQIVETFSQNQYLKRSAQFMLNSMTKEVSLTKKYTL